MKEVKKMDRDEYGHYVNDEGVEIKVSTDKNGKDHIDIYDSCPAENPDHGSIHINYDSDTGKGTIVDTTSGEKETTDTSCYLTTACMRNLKNNFDDQCYQLDILRWFRDKFVSQEDKEHYYEIAPIIVNEIEKSNNKDNVYKYIYDNVVLYCVRKIEDENFDEAYSRYKNSVLALENQFVKSVKQQPHVKKLILS